MIEDHASGAAGAAGAVEAVEAWYEAYGVPARDRGRQELIETYASLGMAIEGMLDLWPEGVDAGEDVVIKDEAGRVTAWMMRGLEDPDVADVFYVDKKAESFKCQYETSPMGKVFTIVTRL